MRSDLTIADETADAIRAHAWPGGIMELLMHVERVAVWSELDGSTAVTCDDLGLPPPPSRRLRAKAAENDGRSLKLIMDEYEEEVLRATLARHGGNKSSAARELAISRSYLIQKCHRYGIDDKYDPTAVQEQPVGASRKRQVSGSE